MKQYLLIIFSLLTFTTLAQAQQDVERKEKMTIDGQVVTATIIGNDTMFIAESLDDIAISSPKDFKDRKEYLKYRKYKYYASKVYPYGAKAIRIFKEVEHVTKTMKPRKRKKHIKRLQKEYKKEFKEPLKKLTKTQGKILIKMIEKELDTPFYDLLKGLRGGMTASYWHQLAKVYGYNLKEGYTPGEDHIMDIVLNDLDLTKDD